MKKVALLACSSLLAFSSSVFAEGFYFQGGGGAGFVNGEINQAGMEFLGDAAIRPVVDDQMAVVGAWFVGLGYMFSNSFGVEANYLGYTNTNAKHTTAPDGETVTTEMSNSIYQINLLGVARTPFEVGFGFFVKAKAGVGYTDQHQDLSGSTTLPLTVVDNNQADKKFSPVLGIGIERDFTDLISVSLEYVAAINNEVENSMVFLAVKFNPFDVIAFMGY